MGESQRRDYIVLAALEGDGLWRYVGTYNKLGTGTAVREAAKADSEALGEPAKKYVAIPERNFSIFEAGVTIPEPQLRIKEWDGVPTAPEVHPDQTTLEGAADETAQEGDSEPETPEAEEETPEAPDAAETPSRRARARS